MLHKESALGGGKRRVASGAPGAKRRSLDSVFAKDGVYDGRLFHSRDKMTYTYLNQGEVIALHFDNQRRELFFKGHHITDLGSSAEMREHILRFRAAILQEARAHVFLSAFDIVVAGLCKQAGIEGL